MNEKREVKEAPSTGLKLTAEDNPCPICEDTSGKCATGMGRQGTEAKDGVLCSSCLNEESTPAGWKFSGASKPDKNGIQKGKFYPVNDKQKTGRIVNPLFVSTVEDGLQAIDPSDSEKRTRVGLHMQATAYINSPDQNGAALLLEFSTIRGEVRKVTMLRSSLSGNSEALIADLLANGYNFQRGQKWALLGYLQGLGGDIEKTYTVTDTTGWIGDSFVAQTKTYGDESIRFRDVENVKDTTCGTSGTLQGWIKYVAKLCGGNSRAIFAIGVAFAAPLLARLGFEGGGFHFHHLTSVGKTVLLLIAASVGGIKRIPRWNVTQVGLEAIAVAHSNMLLPLDEIGEADDRLVGKLAYMLANGVGRAKGNRDSTNRTIKTWKLLFMSTGEIKMSDYLKQAGLDPKGGMEVRMPDIPAASPDSTYGVFDYIHEAKDSKEFAQALEANTAENHGTAMDAYLSRLVPDLNEDGAVEALRKRVALVSSELTVNVTDNAVRRIADRFAIVQVALGLAHSYGLLPFPVEQIAGAVKKVFQDWLVARGGEGSIELKNAVKKLRRTIETELTGNRVYDPKRDWISTNNILGYVIRATDGEQSELCIRLETFKAEFCGNVGHTILLRELRNLCIVETPADGKLTVLRVAEPNSTKQRRYIVIDIQKLKDLGDDDFSFFQNKDHDFPGVSGVISVSDGQNPLLKGIIGDENCLHSGVSEVSAVSASEKFQDLLTPLTPEKNLVSADSMPSNTLPETLIGAADTNDTADTAKTQSQDLKKEKIISDEIREVPEGEF
jgi:uncharacterized protein (DUF927 family)